MLQSVILGYIWLHFNTIILKCTVFLSYFQMLGYQRWENFEKVIEKAIVSISNTQTDLNYWLLEVTKPIINHFVDVTKMGVGNKKDRQLC